MAYSDTQIANVALTQLGLQRIESLTEDSEEAKRINALYALTRDELLQEIPWTFAVKRTTLAQLSETPEYGYSYKFQLPDDCLSLLDRKYQSYSFRVEGKTLLCDSSTLYVRYIARIEDPAQFTPLFAQLLALRLALRLSYATSGSGPLMERIKLLHDEVQAKAKARDAQSAGTPKSLDDDTWLDSRY